MFRLISKGSFKKTTSFLESLDSDIFSDLERYGQMGVDALARSTPKDSGLTANSWDYVVTRTGDSVSIYWTNTNVNDGAQIAILLQYGHGTGTGGFVAGQDYINPAIQPIFDKIQEDVWRKVKNG